MSRERACILIGWVHSQGQTISRIYQGAIVFAPQLLHGNCTKAESYQAGNIMFTRFLRVNCNLLLFRKQNFSSLRFPLPPFVNLYFPQHKSTVWNMHMVCFLSYFLLASLDNIPYPLFNLSVLYSQCEAMCFQKSSELFCLFPSQNGTIANTHGNESINGSKSKCVSYR